jgi:high-affinity Fe2+/Pb2+ permease
MQLAQFTGLGLVVVGGLLAMLLRSGSTSGPRNAMVQSVAGVVIGLLGAFAILVWTTDLVPDDIEWVGAVVVAVVAVLLIVAVRMRGGG